MKKSQKLVHLTKCVTSTLIVVSAMLCFSACKDEKETKGKSNHFSVDGTVKPLKAAIFVYDQTPSKSPVNGADYYRHELLIYSDGFTFSEANNRLSGSGNAVDLLITGGSPSLDAGTYTFTATEENPKPFEVWDGTVYLNYSTSTQQGEMYVFKTGTFKVEKEGQVFALTIEGTAYPPVEDGPWGPDLTKPSKSIKGYYKGSIAQYPD